MLFAACSSNDELSEPVPTPVADSTAIAFSPSAIPSTDVMTRAGGLTPIQDLGRYDFGVFATKKGTSASSSAEATTMRNFLVGYNTADGQWTYEGRSGDFVDQPLVYWDHAYDQTSFFAYSPYYKSDSISFNTSTSTMTINHSGVITDSYINTLDGYDYNANKETTEFLYGNTIVDKSDYGKRVEINFYRVNAQLRIAFFSDVTNYNVEIVDLDADSGRIADGFTGYQTKGIQATPYGNDYVVGYKHADIDFSSGEPTMILSDESNLENSSANLFFRVPSRKDSSPLNPSNLTKVTYEGVDHYCIPQTSTSGEQTYSFSPTTYCPVSQRKPSQFIGVTAAGFTFHVTMRLIPKAGSDIDHKVTTVRNATVYIPPYYIMGNDSVPVALWQAGARYTYHFKITDDVVGSTDPAKPIDPTDPTASGGISLVDFEVYFPNPSRHDYERRKTYTIPVGEENPDEPADAKRNWWSS